MKNTLFILILLLTIVSCEKSRPVLQEKKVVEYKDTTIFIKINNQNIKIGFDSIGNIEYLTSKSKTNIQNVFFNQFGFVKQIQNCQEKKIENILSFYESGQLEKIDWEDLNPPKVNIQYLWFCESPSKSIIIDQDKSFIPKVSGLTSCFTVNKIHSLKLTDISVFPSSYEIEYLDYDRNNLEVTISKKDKSEIFIKSIKPGTYRLVVKLISTFHFENVSFRSDLQGTYFKIDINLTFK